MTPNLPPTLSSSQDLAALILEIREYAKWYGQYSVANRVKAKFTTEQPELSTAAVEMIRDWGKEEALSQKRLDLLLSSLEKLKAKAPVITITLAAPATTEVKKSLVSWCRTNIAPDVLVSFRFNATLLGGMVVRSGSHIYDWSFRRTILNERHRFGEILSRV
jgi:F0F1-type ATP synthase delta subunit